jgi:hypothetical protein
MNGDIVELIDRFGCFVGSFQGAGIDLMYFMILSMPIDKELR